MANLALAFNVLAKDNASKTFDKVGKSAESAGKKGAALGTTMRKGLLIGAAAVAAFGAASFVLGKKLVTAGEAASTSDARIGQVAKSMGLFGGQTKVVTDRLVKLAEKTALQTGVDQNAIKLTQAKLLTFKELAKSADQVGGAFDQANQAAIDMAAAGFGTAEGNAVQLGKALNDPVKGVTALNKSGITFTATEKARIKTLVESNKMGEAQAVVLKAIQAQVGGTAVATANASDQMKVLGSQVQEQVGKLILPLFNKFAGYMINTVGPAVQKFFDNFRDGEGVAGRIKGVIQTITTGFSAFFAALKEGDVTSDGFVGKMETIGDFLHTNLPPAIETVKGLFGGLKDTLYKVGDSAKLLWPPLKDVAKQLYEAYSKIGLSTWDLFKLAIKALPTVIDAMTVSLTAAAKWIGENKTLVGALVTAVVGGSAAFKAYKGVMLLVTGATKAYAAVQGILNAVMSANPIGIVIVAIAALAAGLIYAYNTNETFRTNLLTAWSLIKTGALTFAKVVITAVGNMATTFLDVVTQIVEGAAQAFGWVPGLGPKLEGAARDIGKFRDSANAKLDAIKNDIDVQIKTEEASRDLAAFYKEWSGKTLQIRTNAYADVGNFRGSLGGGQGGEASGGLGRPVPQAIGTGFNGYPGHKGIDFLSPVGTSVRAPMAGIVTRDGWDSGGFGTHVRTADADGRFSIFGHLSREVVSVGQRIAKGQLIGFTGNTGNSTGPHLHMERRTSAGDRNSAYNFAGSLARAMGGPVWPGGVFAVGDNRDGSWNATTELFVPDTAGRIVTQDQMGRRDGHQGGSGLTRGDIDRLVRALEGANMHATISGGSMDRAMAARL